MQPWEWYLSDLGMGVDWMCFSIVSLLCNVFLDRLSSCWDVCKEEGIPPLVWSHLLIPRFTGICPSQQPLSPPTLLFLLILSPSLENLAHLPCFHLPVSCRFWPLCALAISPPWCPWKLLLLFTSTGNSFRPTLCYCTKWYPNLQSYPFSKLSPLLSLKHNLIMSLLWS